MWATPIACSASLAGRCPHSPTGPTTANPPTTHHHTKGGRPTRPHFHLREPFSQPPPHSHFHLLDNGMAQGPDISVLTHRLSHFRQDCRLGCILRHDRRGTIVVRRPCCHQDGRGRIGRCTRR